MRITHEIRVSRDSDNTFPEIIKVEQTEFEIDLILEHPYRKINILKTNLEKLLHNIINAKF